MEQRAIADEWKELTAYPEMKHPEKEVRPGDVIVYLLPPEEVDQKDLRVQLMSHKLHASLVIRNEKGVLGRLESPALFGNHFVPFEEGFIQLPYVVLRPKFEGKLAEKFSSRAAFENEINRAGQMLEKLRYEYGGDLVLDVLKPEHRKLLQEKFREQCLVKGDIPGQYCSELPLTALTMIGVETTDGVPISEMLPKVEAILKTYDDKKQAAAVEDLSKAFVEEMMAENTRQLKVIERKLKELAGEQQVAAKAKGEGSKEVLARLAQKKVSLLTEQGLKIAEKAVVEMTRKSYVAAIKKKLRGEKLTKTEDGLFEQKIVRPHDLLKAGGPDWKFEIVGFAPNGYRCADAQAAGATGTHR